jgi:hypothetical protein
MAKTKAKTGVSTAPNPSAGASAEAALAAAQETARIDAEKAAATQARAGPEKAWVCREDCLLADGFHYKDSVVRAAECPPHFGPAPEQPERDE